MRRRVGVAVGALVVRVVRKRQRRRRDDVQAEQTRRDGGPLVRAEEHREHDATRAARWGANGARDKHSLSGRAWYLVPMAVTAKRVRQLALKLENASEVPHFDRTAFRTPRRMFATLAGDGSDVNFMFDLATQEAFCQEAPDAITPVSGGWGRMGATRCELAKIDEGTFVSALTAAHARANAPQAVRPKPPRARKR